MCPTLIWVTSPLGFKAEWVLPDLLLWRWMYISQDPPLVLCLSTYWWLAWWPIAFPTCIHAEVEIGFRSNGQSPAQKTNSLSLCQRPGFTFQCFCQQPKSVIFHLILDMGIVIITINPLPDFTDRKVITKERLCGTYRLSAYWLAKMTSEIPMLLGASCTKLGCHLFHGRIPFQILWFSSEFLVAIFLLE